MNDKKPQGFFIYADRFSAISSMLSMADVGRLVIALCAYFEEGVLPAPRSRAFNACFQMLREDVDRDLARYQNICERNRMLAEKRWRPPQESSPPPPDMRPHADACQRMPAHANTTQPNTTQPNTTQPNTTQPNATQPNINQPNAAQPNAAQARAPARAQAQRTGTITPTTDQGGMTDERARTADPRFTHCAAI